MLLLGQATFGRVLEIDRKTIERGIDMHFYPALATGPNHVVVRNNLRIGGSSQHGFN